MMTKTRLILTLSIACAILGRAATGGAADEAKPAAAKVDWEKMNKDQRKAYMKKVVKPDMQKLFVAFDAKKYANFGCPTCHGDGATDGTFKMPNAKLPKLPQPTDKAGFMAIMQKKPEMAKFMMGKVKPTMASLLGMPEWTPEKPVGFSCYGCHTKEEGAAKPAK
jgi:hypothetical protein